MKLAKRVKNDPFLKNSVIYFAGSMIAAFISYLFHPILGRLLSVDDFGELQTVIAIFTLMSIIMGAFSVVTINITANASDDKEKIMVISELRRILLIVVGIIFAAIVIGRGSLEEFFNFDSNYPFIALAALFPLGALLVFRNGFLQGSGRFTALSAVNIVSTVGRLVFAVILVYFGWRSLGAIGGLVLAQVVTLAYAWYLTRKELVYARDPASMDGLKKKKIRQELKYGLLVLLASGCVAFMNSADVAVVKHYFSPETAGLYSGVSLIAKIIFFATAPIIGVMFPAIKLGNSKRENGKVLLKSLILVALVGGGAYLTFSIFHNMIISLMIGAKYRPLAHLLPSLSLVIVAVSLNNLLVNYFLALRRYYLAGAALLGVALTLVLNSFRNGSLEEIIGNFLAGAVLMLGLLVVALVVEMKKNNKIKK